MKRLVRAALLLAVGTILTLPGVASAAEKIKVVATFSVIGFTRSLATELGPQGVTVNAIAPGLTRTPGTLGRNAAGDMSHEALFEMILNMQSIKRSEEATDLVGAVSFLASEDAGFITGQTLYVNGGLTRTT